MLRQHTFCCSRQCGRNPSGGKSITDATCSRGDRSQQQSTVLRSCEASDDRGYGLMPRSPRMSYTIIACIPLASVVLQNLARDLHVG